MDVSPGVVGSAAVASNPSAPGTVVPAGGSGAGAGVVSAAGPAVDPATVGEGGTSALATTTSSSAGSDGSAATGALSSFGVPTSGALTPVAAAAGPTASARALLYPPTVSGAVLPSTLAALVPPSRSSPSFFSFSFLDFSSVFLAFLSESFFFGFLAFFESFASELPYRTATGDIDSLPIALSPPDILALQIPRTDVRGGEATSSRCNCSMGTPPRERRKRGIIAVKEV